MKICRLPFFCTLAVFGAIASASAATNGFVVPFFRGMPNSEAGYWEMFTVGYGAPGNLPDRPGATTGAVLTQLNPNGFVTGSGNIYNFTDANLFTLTDTTPFTLGTIVLQTRTIGSELDYGSMEVSYSDGAGSHLVAPLFRTELDRLSIPGQGESVSSLWQWDLTGLGIYSYTLSFAAAGSSVSFDSMTLDTWNQFVPVPEPSVLALWGMALLLAARRATRRLA